MRPTLCSSTSRTFFLLPGRARRVAFAEHTTTRVFTSRMESSGGRGRGRGRGRGGRGENQRGDGGGRFTHQKREHATQRGPNPPHKRRESNEGKKHHGGERVRLNQGSQRALNEAQPGKQIQDGGNVPTTMAFQSMGLSAQSMRAITEHARDGGSGPDVTSHNERRRRVSPSENGKRQNGWIYAPEHRVVDEE